MKGFDKLLNLIPEDEVTRVFSDGVTTDNVNEVFNCYEQYVILSQSLQYNRQHTLLSLATSLDWWNKPDDLEVIRCLLTMGAEATQEVIARVSTQKQMRMILEFGVDSTDICLALSSLHYHTRQITYTKRLKDFVMYGVIFPKGISYISDTASIIRSYSQNAERRIGHCRSALLTLILCIQHKYKPLKWLIRQLARRIWSMHPFCSDLETPSASPRSDVWDWDEKNRASSKKQKK